MNLNGWTVNIDSKTQDSAATSPQLYDFMVTLTKANYAGTTATQTWSTPNPWRVAKISELDNVIEQQIGVLNEQEDIDTMASVQTGAYIPN